MQDCESSILGIARASFYASLNIDRWFYYYCVSNSIKWLRTQGGRGIASTSYTFRDNALETSLEEVVEILKRRFLAKYIIRQIYLKNSKRV